MSRRAIKLDVFLPHPSARVWRAMTEAQLVARWLMPGDLRPVVGHRFTFEVPGHGATECEILEAEPERLLRMSWRNGPLDTIVTWRLVAEERGTRLFIEQSGFDPDDPAQRQAFDAMGAGWRGTIVARLDDVLSEPGQRQPANDPSAFPAASRTR